MDKEFHYTAVYILANAAGFDTETSLILAASSQLVDDAVFSLDLALPDRTLQLTMTQNYEFWNTEIQNDVYLPFHFIPGKGSTPPTSFKSGKTNEFSVVANGTIAKDMLVFCLEEKNPYLIGIGLHAFADTWAHQNFSGKNEEWNRMRFPDAAQSAALTLSAGHMQAGHLPDKIGAMWEDPRLEGSKVDNNQRFLEAAKKIYRYLCIFQDKNFNDEDFVLGKLASVWSHSTAEERSADYVIDFGVPDWSYTTWFEEAGILSAVQFETNGFIGSVLGTRTKHKLEMLMSKLVKPDPVSCSTTFYSTNLYRWIDAAKSFKQRARDILAKEQLLT